MTRTMTSQEARTRFGDLLGFISRAKEPVIVEDEGKPVAVVITPEQYDRLQEQEELLRERMWQAIERIQERNADKDPDEELASITRVVDEVRRERREREQREAARHR